MHRLLRWLIAVLCILPILSHPPARAQNPSGGAGTSDQNGAGISDQKLDATAAAMARVSDLQKTYQQKLKTAAPQDQDQVVKEADTALEKAVTDQGLSVNEYTTILETAQNDASVRERLVQRLRAPAK
jgi:Domain of unknown function (DUF4168)